MAISCTPANLAAAAKCFQCLPSEQKEWIDTYLLALIAGGSTDPNTLARAAKGFQAIPPGMLRRIQAYLLCQVAARGGGTCPQDMQVAWTPTNLKLGELMGYRADVSSDSLPGITSLTFNQATSINTVWIGATVGLASISFPNLTSQNGSNAAGVPFTFYSNSDLTSLSAPLLSIIGRSGIDLEASPLLTTLSLPSLVTCYGGIYVDSCGLVTVSLPVYLPTTAFDVIFTNCALSAASVNHILARCIASAGYVSGTVNLSGGTSSAPTGQGIVDKAALILRGLTVTTN